MNYHIEAETKHRIRIRIGTRKLTEEQAKILKYAFSHAPGVSEVTVYKASAGCAITYAGDRREIIRRLDSPVKNSVPIGLMSSLKIVYVQEGSTILVASRYSSTVLG